MSLIACTVCASTHISRQRPTPSSLTPLPIGGPLGPAHESAELAGHALDGGLESETRVLERAVMLDGQVEQGHRVPCASRRTFKARLRLLTTPSEVWTSERTAP